MIGSLLLSFILILSLAALFFNRKSQGYEINKATRILQYVALVVTVITAGYLISLFMTDRFEYEYVWAYSSVDLAPIYKFTGLWAGQQGSFLLWLLLHAIAGTVLLLRKSMNRTSFSIYLLLQVLLVLLLFAKNPFDLAPVVEADGAGLNPLLQNIWMVSHPPLLFMGYAFLAIPFCYALGALFTNDYESWLKKARTATILAWTVLGAGIFLGGFWAYETLGWGGYWGWDPVENASLVPWLIATIILHFQFGAHKNKGFFKPMISASIFGYIFVVYGSFLTRSGVLGDFSVHSFSGGDIGLLLGGVVALLTMLGFFVLAFKWQDIPAGEIYDGVSNPNFLLVAAMLVIVVMAIIVTFGMSLPFISGITGKGTAVQGAFYNKTMGPLFVVLLVMLFAYYIRRKGIAFGSAIIHGGVVVMAAGIFISGFLAQDTQEQFVVGQPVDFAGRTITYQGIRMADDQSAKYHVFDVDGKQVEAETKLNDHGQDAAKAPAIVSGLTGDLYFAPAVDSDPAPEITIKRGGMAMGDGILIAYEKGNISTMGATGNQSAQTLLRVTDGKKEEEVTLSITKQGQNFKPVPIIVLDGHYRMELHAITGNFGEIKLTAVDLDKEKVAPIQAEVSFKPFIWLVWTGAILLVIGGVCRLVKFLRA